MATEQLSLLTTENLRLEDGFEKRGLPNAAWHWLVTREQARIRMSQEKYLIASEFVRCVTHATEDSICESLPLCEEVKEQIRSITSVNTLRDVILRLVEANGYTMNDVDPDNSITRVAREHCADFDASCK